METQTMDLVLWAHSLDDYKEMFALTESELDKPIVDCASGCSSFNAQMYAKGRQIVSCDPIYDLPLPALRQRVYQALSLMHQQIREQPEGFLWHRVGSLAALEKKHQEIAEQFLADFSIGHQQGRYQAESVTALSFIDHQFKLALCAHFLFGVPELSLEFHIQAIQEMCRVASELRIFPLLGPDGEISSLLGPVMLTLQQKNYGVEVKQVPYHFQKNGNAMLRVWPTECKV